MKKIITISAICATTIILVSSGILFSLPKTPPPAKTGAPGEGTCSDCHTGAGTNMGPGNVAISFSGSGNKYKVDKFYTVTVTVTDPDKIRFGFQNVTLDAANNYVGSLKVVDTVHTRVQKDNATGRKYINNYSPDYSNIHVWTYKWKSNVNVGNVTFYGTGNATNGDDLSSGDNVYTTTLVIKPKSLPGDKIPTESDAKDMLRVYPNPISSGHFTVSFSVEGDKEQMVTADLLSIEGKYIQPLFSAVKEGGQHEEMVHLSESVTPGLYLVALKCGDKAQYLKVIVGM